MRIDAAASVIEWQAKTWASRTCETCNATSVVWTPGELRVIPAIYADPRVSFSIVCPSCGHSLWFDAAEEGVTISPGALQEAADR
jgi:hypothetical protein